MTQVPASMAEGESRPNIGVSKGNSSAKVDWRFSVAPMMD